jgi:hypothetical protein
MTRHPSGRDIFFSQHELTDLSEKVIVDIINEVRSKLQWLTDLTYDLETMKKYADTYLVKEVQADCNGFLSESSFVSTYFATNIHGQFSSTKRNLLTDFLNYILRITNSPFYPYEPSMGIVSYSGTSIDDELSGFTFADDYEMSLLKYDNYYEKKCPISDVVKVISELVRENPGQEAVYYLDKIDFYTNPILKIHHRSAFEFSLQRNFKSLQNDIWQVINLGNDIIIFDLK